MTEPSQFHNGDVVRVNKDSVGNPGLKLGSLVRFYRHNTASSHIIYAHPLYPDDHNEGREYLLYISDIEKI
jgi:hypothetical protein